MKKIHEDSIPIESRDLWWSFLHLLEAFQNENPDYHLEWCKYHLQKWIPLVYNDPEKIELDIEAWEDILKKIKE